MKRTNSDVSVFEDLSRRQVQILKMIVDGNTDKEIAGKLGISFNTARTHHQNILNKTGQRKISGLIHLALKHNFS